MSYEDKRSEYYFKNWFLSNYSYDDINDDSFLDDLLSCFNNNICNKCLECKYFPYSKQNCSDGFILSRSIKYFRYHDCIIYQIMQKYYCELLGD